MAQPRTTLPAVTGLVVLVAVLSSCSTATGERASRSAPTTLATSTSSSSSSSSTTTTAPTFTASSGSTTTALASSPEGYAEALYTAWTRGDRAAAEEVAQAEAVAALFVRPWQLSDGWSFVECSGAAGSIVCTWQRPSGQQLLVRVQNMAGGLPITVSDVRFQP